MLKPDGLIYIATPAEVCLDRINRRGRIEEKEVESNYINLLSNQYDIYVNNSESVNFIYQEKP